MTKRENSFQEDLNGAGEQRGAFLRTYEWVGLSRVLIRPDEKRMSHVGKWHMGNGMCKGLVVGVSKTEVKEPEVSVVETEMVMETVMVAEGSGGQEASCSKEWWRCPLPHGRKLKDLQWL